VRGASIIRQNPADFVRNTFELRPIHTAKLLWITIFYRLFYVIIYIMEQGLNNPKKILVAEDEKPLAQALALKLGHAGFFVKNVADGKAVLEELKKEYYDVLLLDLIMPKAGGFTVLEEMKKQGINTKVIVLSNLVQDEDKKKARDFGVEFFLEKANTPIADVVQKVNSVLGV